MRNYVYRTLDERLTSLDCMVRRLARLREKEKRPVVKDRESMTEREFVRFFGVKACAIRLSQRADFVGLLIMGKSCGFTITRDEDGVRRLRLIEDRGGKRHVTQRFIELKHADSASNLARGLLNYVQ